MKCKFCSFSTSNKTVMLNHLKVYHASKLKSIPRSSGGRVYNTYSTNNVTVNDDSILENLSFFAAAETYSEMKDESFIGGGGTFDGGGASDSYDSPSYSDSSSSVSSDSSSSSSDDW